MQHEKLGDVETVLEQEKEKKIETKTVDHNVQNHVLDDNSPLQEPSLVVSTDTANDNEMEKIIRALQDCLPSWVTQEQISELISSSGRNIVEIVDKFYERETEFYEQIYASTSSVPKATLAETVALVSQPDSIKSSADIHSSQVHKHHNIVLSMKSSVSPGRKKNKMIGKAIKKAKSNSKLDSTGPKQSTITKFFNKVVSNESRSQGFSS